MVNIRWDPSVDWSFVSDDQLRKLLEEYHRQAVAALEATAYLGTIVACGGVLEGLLAWALLPKVDAPDKPVEQWELSRLIKSAEQYGLIGSKAKQAVWSVNEFRNFIHPYKLLREKTSTRPDDAIALNALTAVKEIARSLRERLTN